MSLVAFLDCILLLLMNTFCAVRNLLLTGSILIKYFKNILFFNFASMNYFKFFLVTFQIKVNGDRLFGCPYTSFNKKIKHILAKKIISMKTSNQ